MPTGIYIHKSHSEETRKKISNSLLGNRRGCGNKGNPKSKKHCRNISEGKKGKSRSEETKKKISEAQKGKKGFKHSEEAKRKMSEVKKGLKNGMWIKDRSIVLEGKKARKSTENNNWKKKCKENDGNTCQKYGIKGSNLAVHHINNFADFPPELRFVIDNGITLSYKAYKEFHKIYGRKNNTREQLEEFLTKEIEDKHNIK